MKYTVLVAVENSVEVEADSFDDAAAQAVAQVVTAACKSGKAPNDAWATTVMQREY